jgi:hypothetical protein
VSLLNFYNHELLWCIPKVVASSAQSVMGLQASFSNLVAPSPPHFLQATGEIEWSKLTMHKQQKGRGPYHIATYTTFVFHCKETLYFESPELSRVLNQAKNYKVLVLPNASFLFILLSLSLLYIYIYKQYIYIMHMLSVGVD